MEERVAGRVVVGVDGSEHGQRALAWAGRYVRATGGHLVAVTAWRHHPVPSGTPMDLPTDLRPEATARTLLSHALAQAEGDGAEQAEQVVVEASAAAVLIDESRDADLLVLGSRGHGGFAGMLLGSVSAHCAHHAHCPVVIVRP
jgi:nucleotide-binding universal stress UspA family protein